MAQPPKQDEKGVKRGNSSADSGEDDEACTVEKKIKREGNDATELSGNLIHKAFEDFEFLDEVSISLDFFNNVMLNQA